MAASTNRPVAAKLFLKASTLLNLVFCFLLKDVFPSLDFSITLKFEVEEVGFLLIYAGASSTMDGIAILGLKAKFVFVPSVPS